MTFIKCDTIQKAEELDRRYLYNALNWVMTQSPYPDRDGNVFNTVTLQDDPWASVSPDTYDPSIHPLLGRCLGKLDKHHGFITGVHYFREAVDGCFYAKKRIDKDVPAVLDDDSNVIVPAFTVPGSSEFYTGCTDYTETEIEPEWVEV